jgi:diamine N-acetyltransferase
MIAPLACREISELQLQPITPDNQAAIRSLSVSADQSHLVATVDQSLADAYVWKDAVFRGAYHDAEPVGYVMVFPFDRNGERVVNIVRLMIDARFQGRGLGRTLLTETLEWIGSFEPPAGRIRISTLPDNDVALRLYRSLGFEKSGTEEGEIALYRPGLS